MRKIEDAVRKLDGVWPGDNPKEVYLYRLQNSRYVASAYDESRPTYICTRYGFEEFTKELRNEPSWDDAPDWAVAKAQDNDGWWHWYSHKLLRTSKAAGAWVYKNTPGRYLRATQGEVIGDWRDTLRLRPEEEEKVEDENDWYAKGELPPVGTVCRLRFGTTAYAVVTITYIGDGVLCYRDEKGMEYSASSSHVELRPIQTDRERWVAAAQQAIGCEPNAHRHMLGQLYDAGLAKMPEDE